jgi:hypothetical protein
MWPLTNRDEPAPPPQRIAAAAAASRTRVARQAEVVVGTQQQHRLAVEQDVGPHRRFDEPQAAAQPGGVDFRQPLMDGRHVREPTPLDPRSATRVGSAA